MALLTKDRLQERHARRESHEKTIKLGSQHDPPAAPGAIMEGAITPAGQPREESRRSGPVWTVMGLAVAWHILRDRRLYAGAIVGVLALTALTQIALRDVLPELERPFIWYWTTGRPRRKGALPAR
jgi:hypothetical protein